MVNEINLNEEEKKVIQNFLEKNEEWLKNNDLLAFENISLFVNAYEKYLQFLGLNENENLNAFLKDIRISMFVSMGSQRYKKQNFLKPGALDENYCSNNMIINRWFNRTKSSKENVIRIKRLIKLDIN